MVNILRVFGWLSIIGGLLIVLIHPWQHLDPHSFVAAYFYLLSCIFIALGLSGHYLFQYKEIGGFGFFSFLLLSTGFYLWIGFHWFQTFAYPDLLKSVSQLSLLALQSIDYGKKLAIYALCSGFLLFSGISLWKGILSRWSTALLFLVPFTLLLPYGTIAAHVLGGISFFWSGITLCRGNNIVKEKQHQEAAYEKKLEANQ